MLPSFITDTEQCAELEGNVGRKVTRYLERLFPLGMFQYDFDCLAGNDLVDYALFILRMQKCKEILDPELTEQFNICVQSTSYPGLARVTVTPVEVPDAMRDKQELLRDFAVVMRRFVAFAIMTDRSCLDKSRLEHLGGRAFTSSDVQYTYLAELVGGNYAHLEHTGGNFVLLAGALNPVVGEKFQEALRCPDPVDA